MDIEHEEKLLLVEVQTLAAEMMTKAIAVLSDKSEQDRDRRQMAVALAGASRDLGQFLPEDGDWLGEFGGSLEATIEAEEDRYESVRFDEDRRKRIIVLGNLRVLKRLRSRLTDPRRRQALKSLIYTDPLYPPDGLLPPGVTFPFSPGGLCPEVPTQK